MSVIVDPDMPSDRQLANLREGIIQIIEKYEQSTNGVRDKYEQVRAEAKESTSEVRATNDATNEPYINKEIKNIEGQDNAPSAPSSKSIKRKAKKKSTTRPKISLDNPCASCPARDTKSDRFVDGEGT